MLGLNPHAGESGKIGQEEIKIITNLIDLSINNYQNESELLKIKNQVNDLMSSKPLFKW